MTKISEIFDVLYESDLMPVTDGEIIILPNVSLSKIVDLTSKLGALDSGLEPMGYNRYQLILPDEIDMEMEEEVPEEPEEKSEEQEEIKDSEEDKSEEESESEEEKEEKSEEKDSEKDGKMDKAVEEICDIIKDWTNSEPVNEAYEADETNANIIKAVANSCNTSEEDAWEEILSARQNYEENIVSDPERAHEYLEWALQDLGIEPDYTMDFLEVPCDEVEADNEDEEDEYDADYELEKLFNGLGEDEVKDLKKNEVATYLESFANPNEIYEAQEDEYIAEEEPKAEEAKPASKKGISSYLTAEAEDIIDITEPAEKQALIDLLVHNKEVLWGPTSSKIQAFRKELESLEDADLEAKADEIFPDWKKHIKKYIVEPEPEENMPAEDEAPVEEIEEPVEEPVEDEPVEECSKLAEDMEETVEEEISEEIPEAAEEYQEEIKPEEQILTEEPSEESEEHPEDCECEECLAKKAAEEEQLDEIHMAPGFSAMEDMFEPNWTSKSEEKAKETAEKLADKVTEEADSAEAEQAD